MMLLHMMVLHLLFVAFTAAAANGKGCDDAPKGYYVQLKYSSDGRPHPKDTTVEATCTNGQHIIHGMNFSVCENGKWLPGLGRCPYHCPLNFFTKHHYQAEPYPNKGEKLEWHRHGSQVIAYYVGSDEEHDGHDGGHEYDYDEDHGNDGNDGNDRHPEGHWYSCNDGKWARDCDKATPGYHVSLKYDHQPVNGKYPNGTIVHATCNDGLNIAYGSDNAICANGTWSPLGRCPYHCLITEFTSTRHYNRVVVSNKPPQHQYYLNGTEVTAYCGSDSNAGHRYVCVDGGWKATDPKKANCDPK